ncbi:MAG: Wadjet anti-phage system protein JetA family protein [Anaeroplasma sp.]
MDFFDMVPDNFFSLLASKNKRIYLASIIQVFKVYETGTILGIDKKIVVDDLVYFLDSNSSYLYSVEDEEDEESNPTSKRDLANYILRRMEECGWIYIDVTNDYQEVLNFSDVAITICEAILNAYPQVEYADDELPSDYVNPNEYQGYIYSIYSLLNQPDIIDYALTFSLVFSSTKQLIRAIRRLDARMKEYIASVIENTEIKDLMEKLINYKNDIYDKSYVKLKVSDNIDRYRLSIITRLEEMQSNEVIVKAISKNYVTLSKNEDEAIQKAIKNIDEVIDAFNAIEDFISEIDNKNRNYINSTIGKIKFLLSEDDNVIGKLNTILKFIKDSNKNNKIDKAMRMVDSLYNLATLKVFTQENTLYQPRGGYSRNYNQLLDEMGLEDFTMDSEFMEQFKSSYNEEEIANFLDAHLVDGIFDASKILEYDSPHSIFMMVVYSIILAVEKGYTVEIRDELIEIKRFVIKNFIIKKTLV